MCPVSASCKVCSSARSECVYKRNRLLEDITTISEKQADKFTESGDFTNKNELFKIWQVNFGIGHANLLKK